MPTSARSASGAARRGFARRDAERFEQPLAAVDAPDRLEAVARAVRLAQQRLGSGEHGW
jgi:hypothetical protein